MDAFTYPGSLKNEPCAITVREMSGNRPKLYMVAKDSRFVMYIRKEVGIWQVEGSKTEHADQKDVEAIGREIEKRV